MSPCTSAHLAPVLVQLQLLELVPSAAEAAHTHIGLRTSLVAVIEVDVDIHPYEVERERTIVEIAEIESDQMTLAKMRLVEVERWAM
jgi:hypothetical protein